MPFAGAQGKKPVWSLVYLKDGHVVQGFIKRESADVEVDAYAGVAITLPKGFYLIDDGPRRISFDTTQVARVDTRAFGGEERVYHKKTYAPPRSTDVPAILDIVETSPFDNNWERTLRFRGKTKDPTNPNVDIKVAQHLQLLTPYGLSVETTTIYRYSASYLTREFSPDILQSLLASHPNYKIDRDTTPAEKLKRRFAFSQFMAQAGYFDDAEQELARTLRDLPASKEAIEKQLRVVGEVKARENFEEIKRLAVAGQHQHVLKRIEEFPQKYASEEMLAKMRELKADYDTAIKSMERAQAHLKELSGAVSEARRDVLREAAEAIRAELCIDNVNRLDTFLSQADQYERLKKGRQDNGGWAR